MQKIIIFSLLFFYINLGATSPNWSVNPAAFQYQMTASSRVSIRCNDLNNRTVLVGAFVNDVCRGVDSNHVLTSGYYNTYITIYSNIQIGEKVTFKLYDPTTDIVYDAIDTISFENNKILSSSVYPYLFMSNYRPESITLSRNLVYKTFPKDTKIGDLSTKDKNNTSFTYSIVSNIANNDDYFYISGNSLMLNKGLITDTITRLKVMLRTDDLNGCTYDSLFSFIVLNNDPPPTGLVATDSSIVEHVPLGSLAKKLIAIDASPIDEFIYELVGGVGSEGNSMFKIVGDQLQVNSDLEYSIGSTYPVRIKITDIAKNTVEVPIKILLKEILYKLNPTDSAIEEHIAKGTVAKILKVQDVAFGGATYTFKLIDGEGSKDNYRYTILGNSLNVNSDIEYDSASAHFVRVQMTNIAGNKIEQTFQIKIIETINSTQPLKVNNLISPNGDNINDVFEIYNIDLYKEFHLAIYDDNGFLTNEYNKGFDPNMKYDNSWKGISDKGNKLTTGLYYYYFNNITNSHIFKGSIYLIQSN